VVANSFIAPIVVSSCRSSFQNDDFRIPKKTPRHAAVRSSPDCVRGFKVVLDVAVWSMLSSPSAAAT
jgi:hypothetical protein